MAKTKQTQKSRAKSFSKKNLVQRRKHFVSLLCSVKGPKKRNCLIDLAEPEDVHAVCDCIFNIIRGNIQISKTNVQKLKRHKDALRLIVQPKLSLKRRREALKQKGGFWPLLIPLIGSVISGIIGK